VPMSGTLPNIPSMFCHSPESWKDLWETVVFKRGSVRVDAKLVEISMELPRTDGSGGKEKEVWDRMHWSVTRL